MKRNPAYSSDAWEALAFDNQYEKYGWPNYRLNILSWIPQDREMLLDVGCCRGEYIERIKENGFRGHCVGVDVTSKLIEDAQAKKLPNTTFLCEDCRYLTLAPESFDVVLFLNVLMHLPDMSCLQNIANLSKDIFILSTYGSEAKTYTQHSRRFLNFYYSKKDILSQITQFDLVEFKSFKNPGDSLVFQFLFKRNCK